MRMALLLVVILGLGFLCPTDALCDVKGQDTAVCQRLEDAKYIDSYKLTNLKAPVRGKTLRSTSFTNLPPSMKSLDLSDGEIEVIEPGTFQKMTGLLGLKISDNSIAKLPKSALEGLDHLKNLDLRRNKIRELPSALTTLKSLKNLEISGNPLTCNCATLRVRNDLLAQGVKISKKVYCMTPSHFKGVSLLTPEAEVICMFEEQDDEMQADQAAGSGDGEDERPDFFDELTVVPPVVSSRLINEPETTPEIITDDLIIPTIGRSGSELSEKSPTDVSSSTEPSTDTGDFEFSSVEEHQDDLVIVEGSGTTDADEDGSGEDGSGIWAPIDPRHFAPEESGEPKVSTTEEPTTASPSWYDIFFGPITPGDTTTSSNSDDDLGDYILVDTEKTTTPHSVEEVTVTEEIVTKKADILEGEIPPPSPTTIQSSVTESEKNVERFDQTDGDADTRIDDVGEASTHESKKSMGSYVVLAALLGVLAALIGFAAYKSSICKKRPNEDPERGSELKDVQKSLLDTNNTNQPKNGSNGNAENAPLVEPQDHWAGRQEIRPWSDNGKSKPTVDNGNEYTPPPVESDPIKPPRKSLPPQEDTNGFQEVKTHSPLSTFTPRTHGVQPNSITPPNSPSSLTDIGNRSPPLSPNTQRVKITLQENPDSIPKTPILITRTKPGVNLVKSP